MRIKDLTKRTDNGFTFRMGFGPFYVDGFWYNTDTNNIIPPSKYVGNKRYSIVQSHGVHFKRLRDVIRFMVERDMKSLDTEYFIAAPKFPGSDTDETVTEDVATEETAANEAEATESNESDRWAKYFDKQK